LEDVFGEYRLLLNYFVWSFFVFAWRVLSCALHPLLVLA
jgi:hypothetical protein